MAARVFIDPNDNINAVIARVTSNTGGDLELVVPSGARVLQNIVDAYLLRDAAKEQGKNVTIVTNDVMGKIFAERAGMPVINASAGEGDFFVTETMAKMADIVPNSSRKTSTRASTKNQPKAGRPRAGTKKTSSSKTAATKKVSSKRATVKKTASSSASPRKGATESQAKFLTSYKKAREESNGFGDLKSTNKGRTRKTSSSLKWRPTTPKMVVVVLLLALVAAAIVFGMVLPKADIIAYPVREVASFNVDVFVDKSQTEVDVERGIVPGELFLEDKKETREFNSTGLEDVRAKAKGRITIFNEFSTKPQTFIPSRFSTGDGKVFWTTKNITVPGLVVENGKTVPGSARADIIAAEPGEASNIGPSRFTMPALAGTEKGEKIYASSASPTTGGKTGQAVVVSSEDLDNAYGTLQLKLAPELQSFKENLPEGLKLWDEAYNEEIADRSSDKEKGEPANKFNATVNIVARAVAFKEADLEELLNREINSRLSEEQTILVSSKEVTFLKPPVVDYQKGTVSVTLHVQVDVIENMDPESFKGAVLKKNKEEIKQILPNFKGIERVEVKLWPFWVNRVSKNKDRVKVTIFGM